MLRLVVGSLVVMSPVSALVVGPTCASRTAIRGRHSSPAMAGAYDFSAKKLGASSSTDLSEYEGKVSLIVNVASK